jgi:hypothetical protein
MQPTLDKVFESLVVEDSAWSKKTLATLEKLSPLSLCATFQQVCVARHVLHVAIACIRSRACVHLSCLLPCLVVSTFPHLRLRGGVVAAADPQQATKPVAARMPGHGAGHGEALHAGVCVRDTAAHPRVAARCPEPLPLPLPLRVTVCAQGHDFYEGVHSVLVEKGKTPKWQYRSVAAVPADAIEAFFRPHA